jgi:hypothetical protein
VPRRSSVVTKVWPAGSTQQYREPWGPMENSPVVGLRRTVWPPSDAMDSSPASQLLAATCM